MKRAAVLVIVAAISAGAALAAQQSGFTRTPLQDQPISVAGHHGVTARVDIGPGVESGRHMHPGEEFGYVLEGALQLEIDGRVLHVQDRRRVLRTGRRRSQRAQHRVRQGDVHWHVHRRERQAAVRAGEVAATRTQSHDRLDCEESSRTWAVGDPPT